MMEGLALVGRVAIVYIALIVMMRLGGRRELAELTPADLITMLIVSETVAPAVQPQEPNVLHALAAAGTLIALTTTLGWLSFKFKPLEHLLEGQAVRLITNGKVNEKVRRKFHISWDQLETTLRQYGVLKIGEVRRAYIESDGEITIVRDEPGAAGEEAAAAAHTQRRK